MASYKNSIALTDNISPTLDRINKSTQRLLGTFQQLNNNISMTKTAFGSVGNSGVISGINTTTASVTGLNTQTNNVANSAMRAESGLRGMSVVKFAVLIRALKQVSQLVTGVADTVDQLSISLAVLDSYNFSDLGLDQLANQLYNISRATRTEFAQTLSIVQDLLATGLFIGDNAAIGATQTAGIINQAVVASGASGNGAEQAANRLTNALSQGTLTAANVTTLLNNTPKIAEYIAEGFNTLGYSIGATKFDLKDLAKEGELTADRVVRALHAASGTIEADFNNIPVTFAQVGAQLSSTWEYFLVRLNQTDGPLQRIAEQLSRITTFLADDRGLVVWNALTVVFYLVASALEAVINALSWFYNLIINNNPIAVALVTALAVSFGVTLVQAITAVIGKLVAMIATLWASNPPLAIISVLLITAIALVARFSDSFEEAGRNIGKVVGSIVMYIYRGLVAVVAAIGGAAIGIITIVLTIVGAIVDAARVLFNVLDTIGAVIISLLDLVVTVVTNIAKTVINGVGQVVLSGIDVILSGVEKLATTIDSVFGSTFSDSIAGARANIDDLKASLDEATNIDGTLSDWLDRSSDRISSIWDGFDATKYSTAAQDLTEPLWDGFTNVISEWWHLADGLPDAFGEAGASLGKNIDDILANIDLPFLNEYGEFDLSKYPLEIDSIGQVGQVGTVDNVKNDVNIADEDWKLLKDIAWGQYTSNLNSITVVVENTFGDINETADADDVLDVVATQLAEKVAIALVN